MLTLLLVYVLGGVTFIPLCLAAFFVHFLLTAPPADLATSTKDAIPSPEELGDTELSQEQKAEALQFAAENAAAHAESEKLKEAISRSQGQGQGQGRGSVRSRRGSIAPQPTGPKPHLSGWLTVRRQFEPDSSVSVAAASSSAAAGSGSSKAAGVDGKDGKAGGGYMSLVYRGLMDYRSNRADQRRASQAAPGAPVANGAAGESPADSRSNSPQPDSTVLSRSPTPAAPGAGTAGKEIFHCILKAPILYLYSSDDLSAPTTECYAAIDMRGKRVSVYAGGLGDTLGEPGDEEDDDEEGTSGRRAETSAKGWESVSSVGSDTETLGPAASQAAGAPNAPKEARNLWKRARRAAIRDGELFMKRNAIRIVGESSFSTGRSGQGASSDAASEKSDAQSVRSKRSSRQQHRPQWFIFARSATSMEDWYHALLHASLMPTSGAPESAEPDPMGTLFSRSDMSSLLSSLDELPDPIPLRWLNAMVGRVFFSVYRTAWLEDYITSKLMKKISRVRTPGFLGDVRVQEVDVGRAPPAFSRPMLKSLTGDGEASMEVSVNLARKPHSAQ